MPARPLPTPPPLPPERALAEAVAARVGAARYGIWFAGHAKFVALGGEVVVVARNQHSQEWLEHTFGTAVREATVQVHGPGTRVRWVADPESFSEPGTGDRGSGIGSAPMPVPTPAVAKSAPLEKAERPRVLPIPDPRSPIPASQTDLFGDPVAAAKPRAKRAEPEVVAVSKAGRRWKLLGEFVVGACNRVAHASALSVVEDPGEGGNPLVIHGPVGTGKTHLLEGIYAGLKRRPNERPCYTTAEEFTTRFVAASQHGKMSAFRRQFRECSTLLLDDLHFLATKKATQAEFLHTFDALVADGRQVVVTTDCHPRLADELMPELVDRLLGGAVWSLQPPDPETRLEILRKKATGANPMVPDAVLKTLASSLRGNVRELEGAVNSVKHYAKVTGRPVDQSVVREALGDLLRHAVRTVSVADVDASVCAVLRLGSGTLQSKSRAWAVTHPRMVAIYLCRKHTAATYGEVSKHFGAKTHSTAVAAEKKVRAWIEKDASVTIGDRSWRVKELIDRIERELQR
ncbi:chromosomal replication initiator protein DnaA [Gemmata sp.]|uniref:chromosomal replication initiator protein DnaA n=1 Tax=Gemmata sp. TaxID=1914242 RepID=UPI003F7264AB